MSKPVVGVIGNAYLVDNRFTVQIVGEKNLRAIAEVTGALPLMFAGAPEITDTNALLSVVDGILRDLAPKPTLGTSPTMNGAMPWRSR